MEMTFPTSDLPAGGDRRPLLDPQLFTLSPKGLSETARAAALSALSEAMATQRNHCLGYQVNQGAMYGDLAQYLTIHLNNEIGRAHV